MIINAINREQLFYHLKKKLNNETIVTALPTEDIKEHTLYILDKGNDKYETYIHDTEKGWILIGSPEEKGMKVADVDDTMSEFPTQRPDGSDLIDGDWVVSAQTSTYPFDLPYGPASEQFVTFTEAGQKAVYNKDASKWSLDVTDGIKKVKVDGQELEIDPTTKSVDILLNKDPETLEYDTTDGLSVLYDENHGLTCNEPGDPDKGIKVKWTEMTQAEWDSLTPEQQATSGFVKITDGEYSAPVIYRHVLAFHCETSSGTLPAHVHITIYKTGRTAFTPESLCLWIQDKGIMSCTGKVVNGGTEYNEAITALGPSTTTANNAIVLYASPERVFSRNIITVTDTVTEL